MNYNKSILIGNLTKDTEVRYTPQGTAVVNFTLAVNRKYKSGEETKEDVAFIPCVAWGKTAELINQYCKKGSPLFVEGRLQTRSWEKDGQKQYKTEVVAENIQLLGTKKEEPNKAIDQTSEQTWLSEQEG
jgi:single-strand DNA-binding protein